ncbi:hypothetical protein [Naasia aerilata]|uniref:Uncharacterized protein n=1 Tax=Naasia aerilata TaxID=1162966 RepID=A0ABN6XQS8_9MICO|nr:hypothetical protein [Naasia aerilata]BDZ45945.1 hypothetical protein GCM10025866_18540 [Naasia aerilata]
MIADDRFVQRLFAPDERITLPEAEFTVESPRTLRALVRRGTRIIAGNYELAQLLGGREGAGGGERQNVALLRSIRTRPALWPPFAIYYAVSSVTRLRARRLLASGTRINWNQDTTTRTG